jgi:hypothetical protein
MIIIIDLLSKESILVEDTINPQKEEPSEPKKPEGFVDLELEIINVTV